MSSNQVRTNDVRNVVLLVDFPRAYTIISFGFDQCYCLVHIVMEFHLYGNLDKLLLSPLTTFSSSAWFMLNIQLVLETSKRHYLHVSLMKQMLDERSDFLWFTHIWCKLPPWVRERLFLFPLVPSQVSHACVKYAMVWQARNLHSICIPSTPSRWLTCSRRRSSFLRVYLMQGLRYPRWWFPTWTR